MALSDITKIPAPRTPIADEESGAVSPVWYRFFYNIYTLAGSGGTGGVPVSRGGTGLTTIGNRQLIIGNASNVFEPTALVGSGITITYGTGTVTLAIGNSGVTPGTYGTASSVGQFTVDAKGTLVFAQNVVIAINANQITSGTIASARILGSYTGITGVGTLTAGTWNATAIDTAYGGTGQTTYTNGQLLIGNTTGNTLTKATLTAGSGIAITNGSGAVTVATNGTLVTTAPVTKTADFSVGATDTWTINNKSGSTCTVTLPSPSANTGRVLYFQNYQAQFLVSASSNVVPRAGGSAGTAILADVAGDTTTLVSDGTNWIAMQYTPNNVLLI